MPEAQWYVELGAMRIPANHTYGRGKWEWVGKAGVWAVVSFVLSGF